MASAQDSASTSGFRAAPGSWSWPDDLPQSTKTTPEHETAVPNAAEGSSHEAPPRPKPRKHYRPRTCRICLDTVEPTFHTAPADDEGTFGGLFSRGVGVASGEPSVSYESESGRLIRPCKCKGSSAYVHEECLQQWRHADPDYGSRNFWQCPTCGFRYRLERMSWGNWIASTPMQVLLTLTIFLVAIFILGFVADPIMNLYLDPYDVLLSSERSAFDERIILDDEPTWLEHFVKGLASLGLLGFAKVAFSLPYWVRFGNFGGGRGNNGRDRMGNVTWIFILLGVITVLSAVWKSVRSWSGRVLKKAGERVMDVQGDNDEDDDDDDDAQNARND
ncbi:hypothetical protein FH972_022447 [Carpinus fangiana]|uniref:RING-CH-type domain-containing protein n=1 Tax=Carpinus fangiana TaxID=176857 RepID=A0A5N6KSN1_9ROSI|nr:hypothetical protein FH972_022447 [Carpinus fangiana]